MQHKYYSSNTSSVVPPFLQRDTAHPRSKDAQDTKPHVYEIPLAQTSTEYTPSKVSKSFDFQLSPIAKQQKDNTDNSFTIEVNNEISFADEDGNTRKMNVVDSTPKSTIATMKRSPALPSASARRGIQQPQQSDKNSSPTKMVVTKTVKSYEKRTTHTGDGSIESIETPPPKTYSFDANSSRDTSSVNSSIQSDLILSPPRLYGNREAHQLDANLERIMKRRQERARGVNNDAGEKRSTVDDIFLGRRADSSILSNTSLGLDSTISSIRSDRPETNVRSTQPQNDEYAPTKTPLSQRTVTSTPPTRDRTERQETRRESPRTNESEAQREPISRRSEETVPERRTLATFTRPIEEPRKVSVSLDEEQSHRDVEEPVRAKPIPERISRTGIAVYDLSPTPSNKKREQMRAQERASKGLAPESPRDSPRESPREEEEESRPSRANKNYTPPDDVEDDIMESFLSQKDFQKPAVPALDLRKEREDRERREELKRQEDRERVEELSRQADRPRRPAPTPQENHEIRDDDRRQESQRREIREEYDYRRRERYEDTREQERQNDKRYDRYDTRDRDYEQDRNTQRYEDDSRRYRNEQRDNRYVEDWQRDEPKRQESQADRNNRERVRYDEHLDRKQTRDDYSYDPTRSTQVEQKVSKAEKRSTPSLGLFEEELEDITIDDLKQPIRAAPVQTSTQHRAPERQEQPRSQDRLAQQRPTPLQHDKVQTQPTKPASNPRITRLNSDEYITSPNSPTSGSPRNKKNLSVHFDDAPPTKNVPRSRKSLDTDGTEHDIDADLDDEGIRDFLSSYNKPKVEKQPTILKHVASAPVVKPSPLTPSKPITRTHNYMTATMSPSKPLDESAPVTYTERANTTSPLNVDLSPHKKLKRAEAKPLPQFFSIDSETYAIYVNRIMNQEISNRDQASEVVALEPNPDISPWRLTSERAKQFKARSFVSQETIDLILYGVRPRPPPQEVNGEETDEGSEQSNKRASMNPVMLRLQIPPEQPKFTHHQSLRDFTMSVPAYGTNRPLSFSSPRSPLNVNRQSRTVGTPTNFHIPEPTRDARSPKLKSLQSMFDSSHNETVVDKSQEGGVRPTIKMVMQDDFLQCIKNSPMLSNWLKDEQKVIDAISVGGKVLKNTKRGKAHQKYLFVSIKQGTLIWCANLKARQSADTRPTAKRSLDLREVSSIKMLELTPQEVESLGVKLNAYNKSRMFYGIILSGERHVEVIMEKAINACQWLVGLGLVIHNLRKQATIRGMSSPNLLSRE
jgi:hypothetical protein